MPFSHVPGRLYAYSIAPLATLFYFHPALAAAVTAAVATTSAIRDHLHHRKTNP